MSQKQYTKKQITEAIAYWEKQLNEASMTDIQSLVDAMKAGEVSFSYRKKDGSIRKARGTLVGHGDPPFFRRGYINYYDLDADGWRMFGRDQLVDGDQAQAAVAQYTPLDTAPASKPKSLADVLLKRSKISREINSESDSQEKRINAIRRKYVFTSDIYSRSTIKRWEWKYGATDAASDNAEYDRMQKEVDNDNVLHAIGARIKKLEAERAEVDAEITSIVLKSVQPKEDYGFYRYSYFLTIVDGAGYFKVVFKKKNTWDTEEFLLRSDGALPSFWQPGMDIDPTWNDFIQKVKAAGGKVQRTAKSEDFQTWCSKLQR